MCNPCKMAEANLWIPVETNRNISNLRIIEEPVEAKKVPLSLYVSPDVKRFVEAQAKREDRTPSNLCDRMLAWSSRWLEKAGSSDVLKNWTARRACDRRDCS